MNVLKITVAYDSNAIFPEIQDNHQYSQNIDTTSCDCSTGMIINNTLIDVLDMYKSVLLN